MKLSVIGGIYFATIIIFNYTMKTHESARSATTRRSIIYIMFAFIILFGLPMFLYTTLIYRAELPVEDVNFRIANFKNAISFEVPVYVDIPTANTESLHNAEKVTNQLIASKYGLGDSWRVVLRKAESHALDYSQKYVVNLIQGDREGYEVSSTTKQVTLVSEETEFSMLTDLFAQTLVEGVFQEELGVIKSILYGIKDADLVMPYSSTYNVVFNLFVENGKPVDWEIEHAVAKIQPVFDSLKHYCDFKISTQLQYYSKLRTEPVYDEQRGVNVINKKDLSTFINFGDWNLNNNDIYPSINFLIFFSEDNYNKVPLVIEGSTTNSFLIPQWGGVQIYNTKMPILDGTVVNIPETELDHILATFVSQLFDLLGVPKTPKSPSIRIDSLHRLRTFKNLKTTLDNLSSLIKLTGSLNEISIPESTKTHFMESLLFYDKTLEALQQSDFSSAIEYSSKSLTSSDKAFFEKEMVQQAYFPSEHKLAVFLPLLGPICTIVFMSILKTLIDMKNSKKTDKEEELKKEI